MKKKYVWANGLLFALCFVVVVGVDMLVRYTQGDDLGYYEMAANTSLWGFLLESDSARVSKNITLYLTMRSGIGVWRVVNAAMFTLFFWVLSKLVLLAGRVEDLRERFYLRFIVLVSVCFMHISIIGYAIFWVTGTQDYLWPCTFGLLSLLLELELFFAGKDSGWRFAGILFFALMGGLGQEQISLMLLGADALLFLYRWLRKAGDWKRHAVVVCVRALTLLTLVVNPMNQIRIGAAGGYAGFHQMSFGKHLFLTTQWVLSGYANEMKLLFVALWLVLAYLLYQKGRKGGALTAAVFTAAALPSFVGGTFLNDMGVTAISNMGMTVESIIEATDNTVSLATMTAGNWVSMLWWLAATVVVTPWLLRKDRSLTCLYLLGMVLPYMLIVSASMYISGGRIFFVSGVLFVFILGALLTRLPDRRKLPVAAGIALLMGLYELAIDLPYYLQNVWS